MTRIQFSHHHHRHPD
ncbi:his operon leader peptide [Serratia liquefaciens]